MSNLSEILEEARIKIVDRDISVQALKDATPQQMATTFGIKAEDRQQFADRVDQIKRRLILYAEKREDEAMWQSIIATLSPEQMQWIQKMDAHQLRDKINPPLNTDPT